LRQLLQAHARRRETVTEIRDVCSRITVLKNDKRAIFSAAAHAQRAADYLHSLQPQQIAEGRVAA
jgi:antirestriction protein ArdC